MMWRRGFQSGSSDIWAENYICCEPELDFKREIKKYIQSSLLPNSTQLSASIQMQSILWKIPSQEHYSTICTDDTLPYWNYHGEPLCTLVGRGPFPWLALVFHRSAHFSSVWHNSQSVCSWTPMMTAYGFLNSSAYPVPDPSFTAFLLAPGGRHNGSFATKTEAKNSCGDFKWQKERNVSWETSTMLNTGWKKEGWCVLQEC